MSPTMRTQARYGMRGDGQNVDGNEPGGANGSYGIFGQVPSVALPSAPPADLQKAPPIAGGPMQQANMQQAQQTGANIGKAINRYRAPQAPQAPAVPGATPNPGGYTGEDGTQQQMGQEDAAQGQPIGAPSAMDDRKADMQDSSPSSTDSAMGTGLSSIGSMLSGMQMPGASSAPQPGAQSAQTQQMQSSQPSVAPAQAPSMAPMDAASGQVGAAGTFSSAGKGLQSMDAMARGGTVTKPTVALLGEDGPEAVVPLNNADARITPGMLGMKQRYRPMTGPQSVHGPMRPLAPSPVNAQEHPGMGKRYGAHPRP